MVSDYKFHLFCKCLKKEKWRLSKDLSLAMMLMIFHCCLWVSHRWEPGLEGTSHHAAHGAAELLASLWTLQTAHRAPHAACTDLPLCTVYGLHLAEQEI